MVVFIDKRRPASCDTAISHLMEVKPFHIVLYVRLRIEAAPEKIVLAQDAVADGQFQAQCSTIRSMGYKFIVVKVLGQIQRQAQPVAVLQLHSRLPLFQPAGFALPPFRPDIAEVDGVAHQIAGRIVLREDIGDLRQAAVHIHRYALLDSLRMQRIQRQEQLVRQFGIRVLAVVGKSDPDALAVVALTSLIRMA